MASHMFLFSFFRLCFRAHMLSNQLSISIITASKLTVINVLVLDIIVCYGIVYS